MTKCFCKDTHKTVFLHKKDLNFNFFYEHKNINSENFERQSENRIQRVWETMRTFAPKNF